MLDEVILRVCDMTMRGSMARELECLIDIDPSTPLALLGDAGRLQQILTNLMATPSNSRLRAGASTCRSGTAATSTFRKPE